MATTRADAAIVVRVDKSTQTMRVIVDGEQRYVWPVSTGRMGYNTPAGTYGPQRLERIWHSRKYDWAPMPHAIFFNGGFAIHGTNMVRRLGRTASHGCIRLAPGNARRLFDMVASQRGATRIVIEGNSPPSTLTAQRRGATSMASAPPRTEQMRFIDPARIRAWRSYDQETVQMPARPRAAAAGSYYRAPSAYGYGTARPVAAERASARYYDGRTETYRRLPAGAVIVAPSPAYPAIPWSPWR